MPNKPKPKQPPDLPGYARFAIDRFTEHGVEISPAPMEYRFVSYAAPNALWWTPEQHELLFAVPGLMAPVCAIGNMHRFVGMAVERVGNVQRGFTKQLLPTHVYLRKRERPNESS